MWRQDNPSQHILAVRGLLPARNNLAALDLVVDIVVLACQFVQQLVVCVKRLLVPNLRVRIVAVILAQPFAYIHPVYLVGLTHRVTEQERIMVAHIAQNKVELPFGQPAYVTVHIHVIELYRAVPTGGEE